MRRVGLLLGLSALAIVLHLMTRRLESLNNSPYPVSRSLRFDRRLVSSPMWAARPDRLWAGADLPVEFTFRPGETLSQVLDGLGLQPAEVHLVAAELARHVDVRRLRPEDRYAALVDTEGRLRGFRLTLSGKGRVDVQHDGAGWMSTWQSFVERSEKRLVRGELDGFLESSVAQAGGDTVLAYVMADVLQWDLDFNRDLRLGDRFEVLYERIHLDGEFHRVGDILALVFENDGRRLEAYRFGEDRGYYDAEGRPLRKLFLRSPLRFSRVTSGFSQRRFHPVLKRYRPHYGIDYGAPAGTPVRATANGVVKFAGWDGGGGKTVKLRHPNGYLTAYLHLSRFASDARPGRRVRQGDVIGYVGSTGLATAPHLDYRMQRDGRWINPLRLKMQPSEPISPERLPQFLSWRDQLRAVLDSGESPDALPEEAGQRLAQLAESGARSGVVVGH